MAKTLFMVVNVDWFFLSHRLPIALAAKEAGYEVTVLAIEEAGKGQEIRSHGLDFIPLPSSRGGNNPIEDLKLAVTLWRLYRKHRPDVIHHVAIKPVLYGSIAARLARSKKFVNAISGLGSSFIGKPKPSDALIRVLYSIALRSNRAITIVQNPDDESVVRRLGGKRRRDVRMIEGSGVDIGEFAVVDEPSPPPVRITLASRMLWDKGVNETVEAARALKQRYGDAVDIVLAGKVDAENRSAISEAQLKTWNDEGSVRWIGHQTDIKTLYEQSHIAILPSYREGLPKSLLEAMSIGRPIVTTETPGCRSLVPDGSNGFLVPVRDSAALAERLSTLIDSPHLRTDMGRASRKLVEDRFSLQAVVEQTLAIYEA